MDESGLRISVRDARRQMPHRHQLFLRFTHQAVLCASADNADAPKTPVTLPTATPLTQTNNQRITPPLLCRGQLAGVKGNKNSLFRWFQSSLALTRHAAPHTVTFMYRKVLESGR